MPLDRKVLDFMATFPSRLEEDEEESEGKKQRGILSPLAKDALKSRATRKPSEFQATKKEKKLAELLSGTPPLGIGEHALAFKIPAADRDRTLRALQEQYKKDKTMEGMGFSGRLVTSFLQGGIQDFGIPLAKMVGALPKLDPDQERFRQQLLSVREREDPTIRRDTPAIGRWTQSAMRMAMPMTQAIGLGKSAGGLAEAVGGGKKAVWAATAVGTSGSFLPQVADQTYTELIGEGFDPKKAGIITSVSAPIEAAIESILPDPFKGLGAGLKGTVRQIVGKVARRLTRNYAKEWSEEVLQGGVRESGKEVARYLDKEIPQKGIGNIFKKSLDAGLESAGPLLVMMSPGVMASGVGAVSAIAQEKKTAIRAEITDFAKRNQTPSRKKWTKDWNLPVTEGESQTKRKKGVVALAEFFEAEQTQSHAEAPRPTQEIAPEQVIVPAEIESAPTTGQPVDAGAVQETMQASAPDVKITPPRKGSEIGDFIEDAAGRVGISTEAFGRGVGFTKHAMQRFLTSRGEFPQEVYEADIRRKGRISRVQTEIGFAQKEYDRAIKKVYKKRKLSEPESANIEAVLRGQVPLESLPEQLRAPLYRFRKGIDAGSSGLIDIGAVQGKLAATVSENRGVYITRTFRAHNEPGWAKSVPVEVRNKVVAIFRQEYPRKTADEIDGLIDAQLYKSEFGKTPIALVKEDHLGAKDLSILKRRRNIPPEFLALLGEYADPRLNYARSMTAIGNLAANHQFQQEIREAGLGTFFSMEPSSGTPNGDLITQIEAGEDSPIHALQGLWTTPEIADAFKRATTTEQMPPWLRVVLSLNGAVKVAKTIWSWMTHPRNSLANVGFMVQNGHWRVGLMGKAFKGGFTGLLKLNNKEWQEYYLEAVELSLVHQSVHAEELRANIRDAAGKGLEKYFTDKENERARGVRRIVKGAHESLASLYQIEDDIPKLYAWENEKARYSKAYPELSAREIKVMTAEFVTNTFPTYSKISEAVQSLRRFPITGPFVSFSAEIYRTTYHSLSLAKKELANPKTRSIGAERLVGNILAVSGMAGVAAAARWITGVTLDDDDDMRYFVAPWQKNSLFAHLGRKINGVFRYIDLSFSDPHATLRKPVIAFLRGDDIKEKLWEGMKEVAEPFAGEEILFKAFTEVWRNDQDGRPVYNPQDTVNQQATDVTAHLWRAFEPGTMSSLRRIKKGVTGEIDESGLAHDPVIETIAMVVGVRIQDLDIRQKLSHRANAFMKDIREADQILLRVIGRRGNVGGPEIMSAYSRSDNARRRIWVQLMETEQAARRLGVGPREVYSILDSAGVSQKDLELLLRGHAPPIEITRSRLKAMGLKNPSQYLERYEALLKSIAEQPEQTSIPVRQ